MGYARIVPKEKRTGPNMRADYTGQSMPLDHIAEGVRPVRPHMSTSESSLLEPESRLRK
jgi:hypothetical protein